MRRQAQFITCMRGESILRRHLLRDLLCERRFDAAPDIDLRQLVEFGGRHVRQLAAFAREIGLFRIGLRN